MPATFRKGDIFHTDGLRAYAHACSSAGTMDTGISVAFKKKWPQMFEQYAASCHDGRFRLGDVLAFAEGDEVVYTLAIQEAPAKKAKISALTKSLKTMVELASAANIDRVGIPRVGTGQAGLDWPRVKKILTEVGEETKVTLVVFEQFIRDTSA